MAFTPNIPAATDKISTSQPQIQANFNALQSFGNGYCLLTEQATSPTTVANEMAIYAKEVAGASQMFLRSENNATEVDFTSARKATTNDSTTLPSGIILKWGNSTSNPGTGTDGITFNTAFPTAILSIQTTIADPSGSATYSTSADCVNRVYEYNTINFSTVTFQVATPSTRVGNVKYTWFAIGY